MLCHAVAEWQIYASVNWVNIVSGNDLPPMRRQAITWTNANLIWIGPQEQTSVKLD